MAWNQHKHVAHGISSIEYLQKHRKEKCIFHLLTIKSEYRAIYHLQQYKYFIYLYIYIHTHIHTYIHAYIHTCIHTHIRVSKMKTLNICYLVIYWTQNAHNNFIFQCSLQCVPHKCSIASEVHGYLYKNYFVWERSHSCTACCTSSSDMKDLPPIASLSGPKTWKSLGARSGEYDGCGRQSKAKSWIVAKVEREVWGRALSCWSKTPVLRSPRHLDLIAGSRWFFRRSAYFALVTVFPQGI